jgi:hypothetical protein
MSDEIKFFGSVDCDKDGNITSDMPAWYFERQIEELREGVVKKKGMLNRGEVASDQIPVIEGQIQAETDKLNEIQRSRPQLSAKNKDKVFREYQSLAKQIGESLPTRKESRDGLVSPYDELKRMKSKHINVDVELARACGCRPVDGKVSGDEANKMFHLFGKTLNENTSIERLRKDGGKDAYKMMHNLTKAILEGRTIKD